MNYSELTRITRILTMKNNKKTCTSFLKYVNLIYEIIIGVLKVTTKS